jgi:Leucine-rich repeat (LRR) protein
MATRSAVSKAKVREQHRDTREDLLYTRAQVAAALAHALHMHTGLLPLCKLEALLLHGNLLTEIAPGALSTLSKLRTLRLDRNKLQVDTVFQL